MQTVMHSPGCDVYTLDAYLLPAADKHSNSYLGSIMAQLLTGLFNGKFGDCVTGPLGEGNLQLGTDWSPVAGSTNKHPILWCLQ
jgi:hypothetical protein